jgi:hypothetical protein
MIYKVYVDDFGYIESSVNRGEKNIDIHIAYDYYQDKYTFANITLGERECEEQIKALTIVLNELRILKNFRCL